MKKLFTAITSAVLCMTMLILAPTQIVASAADNTKKKYISEVKVGMGETSDQASKELLAEGYTIFKDNSGNYADLNKDAGTGNIVKDGPNQKIVYLGYKTTADANDAITDLAVMNMNGGYSFEEYEKVMNDHMDTQIKPFVSRFLATLNEYRENLKKPQDSANYKRANYYKSLLNKLTDDDTGGKPIGDLLLNKTKYEMSQKSYSRLTEVQRKNTCDIVTLLMQGNGQSVQLMETLITKAADSSSSNWIDRFKATSLDKLKESVQKENPNMTPSEVNQTLDKRYNDDARRILGKWDAFNEILLNYDTAMKKSDEVVKTEINEEAANIDENSSNEELAKAAGELYKAEATMVKGGLAAESIAVHDILETIKYGDGTLLEFFERDKSEFDDKENIRELYPIVDSLTGGQLAGLDFLSIQDMITMAVTDENGYKAADMKDLEPASIYQDVNREIYDKGGVALTDAAMRAKATSLERESSFELSKTGIVLWCCTAAAGLGVASTMIASKLVYRGPAFDKLAELNNRVAMNERWVKDVLAKGMKTRQHLDSYIQGVKELGEDRVKVTDYQYSDEFREAKAIADSKSNICKYIGAGFTVLGAILAGVSIYVTISEMKAYYNVKFAPIPKYIVERTDITAENEKGQVVMIQNQTAYYKAALCNRTEGSSNVEKENYKILGDRNDLNGDVGKQWLSLYSVKYKNGTPILADTLKLKTGNGDAPEGYTNGIHRFGEKSVFNLTGKAVCFNDPNEGTYVYFKNETSTVKQLTATGSSFSGGMLALGIVGGVIAGCAFTLIMLRIESKKKKKETATA